MLPSPSPPPVPSCAPQITGVPPAGCSGLRRCVYGRGRLELQGATRWAALPQLVAALLPLGAPLQALAADGLPEAEAELDALKQLPSLRQLRVRRTRGEDVDGVRLHLRVVAPHLEQVQIVG